jgi:hypothetical protein
MSRKDVVMTAAMSVPRYPMPDAGKPLPVLVVGDTHSARFRARATIEAGGLDVLDDVSPEQALEHLDGRPHLSAIWIELDEAPALAVRRLLERSDRNGRAAGFGVVVATRLEHVDEVLCDLSNAVDLLVNADDVERVATLSLACNRSANPSVRELSPEASAARLRQLSEEVSRIAAALSRLSSASAGPPLFSGHDGATPGRYAGGVRRRAASDHQGKAPALGLSARRPLRRSRVGHAA